MSDPQNSTHFVALPAVADDERRSRLYSWLSDRTSRADGSEWEHGSLRVAVDELLRLVR